jgi:hypothetical protein
MRPFPSSVWLVLALACNGRDPVLPDASPDRAGADTGPDTDTEPEPVGCRARLCERYADKVPEIAAQIAARATVDPEFADDFAPLVARGPDAVAAFSDRLGRFVTDDWGCTVGAYTGDTMTRVHGGLGITRQAYDDFVVLIAGVLADNGVSEEDLDECVGPRLADPAVAADFVGH